MYDIVKKLLFARQLKLEKGEVILLGHPITMVPLLTFTEIRKILKKIDATNILYEACKKSGIDYLQSIKKNFKMKTKKDLIEWGVNTISLAGWGNTEVYNFDEKKKSTIIRLYNSTFAKAYGRAKEPVDDVFRGYVAATGVMVFNDNSMEAVEVNCMSMGSKICEFLVKRKSEFDLTKKSVSNQLEINNKSLRKIIKKS